MSYGIIYKATNTLNGKVYVGQTTMELWRRKSGHYSDALNRKLDTYFYRAIRKYGKDAFSWETIETCDNQASLNSAEIRWIDFYNSTNKDIGYNSSSGGDHPVFTDEIRRKMSMLKTGKKMSLSEKERKNRGERFKMLNKSRIGIPLSDEHKKKVGEAGKGRKAKPETLVRMSEAHKGNKNWLGKKHTPETINKMKIAQKGANRGEKSGRATISEYTARTIKKELLDGIKVSVIAKKYNLPYLTVSQIKHKRSWAWLEVA